MAQRVIGVVALLSLSILRSITGSEGQCIRPISNVPGCRNALSKAIFYYDTTDLTPDCCDAVNHISYLCFIVLFPTRPSSIKNLKTICAYITAPPTVEAPPPSIRAPSPSSPPPSSPATPPSSTAAPTTPPPSTPSPSTATPPPSTAPPSIATPPSTAMPATPPPFTPLPSATTPSPSIAPSNN